MLYMKNVYYKDIIKSDFNITDKIYEASELLGIQFLDHIIIGNNKFESVFGAKEELL